MALSLYKTFETTSEEFYLKGTANFLQQSVELTIKFVIENNGVKLDFTHNIESLIASAKDKNIDLHLNEYLKDHPETFSIWEANTRYVPDYKVEAERAKKALIAVNEYLNIIKEKEFISNSDK